MIIQAFNPTTDDLERTYLTSPISASATTLTVSNNQGVAGNDRLLIGEMGTETAEIVTVSGTTGYNTITLSSGTSFAHATDTPIYILQFDQVKFYRSTTGSGGTYSVLTTVAIDVDNDQKKTFYDDTAGLSTYYYKISFYHSIGAVESSLSDPVAGSGYTNKQVGKIIDDMFLEFGEKVEGGSLSRAEILSWMNEVNDDIHTSFMKPPSFVYTREALDRAADQNYLAFPTDDDGSQKMWKFDRMDYNYIDTSTDPDTDETYTLRVVSPEEFRNSYQDNTISATTVNDATQVMALDIVQNRFLYYPPSDTAGTDVFILYYWKYLTEFSSEADTIETPGSKIYKEYIRSQYYYKLAKRETSFLARADRCNQRYEIEKFKLQRHNRKDMGSPRSFGYRGGVDYKGFRKY